MRLFQTIFSKNGHYRGVLVAAIVLAAFPAEQALAKKSQAADDPVLRAAYQQFIAQPAVRHARSLQSQGALATANGTKQQARYRAVKIAFRQLRKRYRWGGTSPQRGFDCSGLTQYSYKAASIKLPRTAAQQYRHTRRISLKQIQKGDLIFFHTRISRKRVNHVGIYVGEGKFIHAPRGGKHVSVARLSHYWKRRLVGIGRV